MDEAKPAWLLDTLTTEASRLAGRIATAEGKALGLAHLPHLSFYELVETLLQQEMSLEVVADMLGMRKGGLHGKRQRALTKCRERHEPALFQVAQYIFRKYAKARLAAERALEAGEQRSWRDDAGETTEVELHEALPDIRFDAMRAALRELVRRHLISERGEVGLRTFRWAGPLETVKGERVDARQVWVTLLGMGSASEDDLAERLGLHDPRMRDELQDALDTLLDEGHIFRTVSGEIRRYTCTDCILTADEPSHRYGAILHHLLAFFATMNAVFEPERSRLDGEGRRIEGGSTYVVEIHPDNPLRGEVEGSLRRIAAELSDLRRRVKAAEDELGPTGPDVVRWCMYLGQVRLAHKP